MGFWIQLCALQHQAGNSNAFNKIVSFGFSLKAQLERNSKGLNTIAGNNEILKIQNETIKPTMSFRISEPEEAKGAMAGFKKGAVLHDRTGGWYSPGVRTLTAAPEAATDLRVLCELKAVCLRGKP